MKKLLMLVAVLGTGGLAFGGTAAEQLGLIVPEAPACAGVAAAAPDLKYPHPGNDSYYGSSFYCLDGYLHGPDGLKEWSGNSNACSDPNKVLIGHRFACFNGYLFGPKKMKKWSGDSNVCGNPNKVKFGSRFVCFDGYLIDNQGNEQWTGNSNYCGTHEIP